MAKPLSLPDNCQVINQKRTVLGKTRVTKDSGFLIYDETFLSLTGIAPTLTVIHQDRSIPFAQQACVFWPPTNSLFLTSSLYADSSGNQRIQITRVDLCDDGSYEAHRIPNGIPGIPYPNGAVNYLNGILFCAQGSTHQLSGLIHMLPHPPYEVKPMLTNFHGRPFNSPNDVVVHSDGSVWFTDPSYGFEQGFRPKPQLPNHVYRWEPDTGDVRVMAEGLKKPNGICFSPDESTLYITEMDHVDGKGKRDQTRGASIHAFTIKTFPAEENSLSNPGIFLTQKRLFAFAANGPPDGIKCDVYGNVWSGVGDGVAVWDAGGRLLGKILIPGGVANFCFGRDGEVFICGERRLWRATLHEECRGGLLADEI
ncbi:MAG: hypothetical protein M1814_002961 [Vezdaea aestivalis]|nr:MAG: hypothetical protein M1814_002961 [Vezdaea aestivalis]